MKSENQIIRMIFVLTSILLGMGFLPERRPPLILVLTVGEHGAPVLRGYQVIHKDLLPGAEPPEVEFKNATATNILVIMIVYNTVISNHLYFSGLS